MKIISFFNLILVTAASLGFYTNIFGGHFDYGTAAAAGLGNSSNSASSHSSRSDRNFQKQVKSSQQQKANAEKERLKILKEQETALKEKQKQMEHQKAAIAQKNKATGLKQPQEKGHSFTSMQPQKTQKIDSRNAKKELLKKAAKAVAEDVIVMEAKKIEARKATSK